VNVNECTTGVSDNIGINDWQINPNPFNDVTILQKQGGIAKYYIYNSMGQLIDFGEVVNKTSIGKEFIKGIYYIKIEENSSLKLLRIIKK
jgi:hypothetical protein